MRAARLTQIRLRRFKSIGEEEQTVDLRPLTLMIGRNSSGKSTVIQSLLLLKQTLEDPRPEVQLSLQGTYLRATSLRELTHGWPDDVRRNGPEITLRWTSSVNGGLHQRILEKRAWLAETRLSWLASDGVLDRLRAGFEQTTEITLRMADADGIVILPELRSIWPGAPPLETEMRIEPDLGGPILSWTHGEGSWLLRMDHFLPYLVPAGEDWELSDDDSLLQFAFSVLYAEPLRALKDLLAGLSFVGASRDEVPPYYAKPTGLSGRTVLPGGGNAPELLYSRQAERVHFAPLAGIGQGGQLLRDEYLGRCLSTSCLAYEELESHLHPKAQSRLAEVLVALARSGRQLLVETHSDHLVRRLRSLTAHTEPESASERWLLEDVGLVEVEQGEGGVTRLSQGQLTRDGSIERWPADFLDEATDEERSIYFAGASKSPPEPVPSDEWLLRDVPPTGGRNG